MIYQHLGPPPNLAGFVQKYLLIHYVLEPVGSDSPKPRLFEPYPAWPEHYMTFTAEGFDLSENPETGQITRISPNAIFRQPLSRVNLYPTATFKLFRVFFHPGAIRAH